MAPAAGSEAPRSATGERQEISVKERWGGAVVDVGVVDGALGVQVRSKRPTSPSFTMAGPRRARDLFGSGPAYAGKVCRAFAFLFHRTRWAVSCVACFFSFIAGRVSHDCSRGYRFSAKRSLVWSS